MDTTFTYERKEKTHVLPFNPELYGFMYEGCQCSYAKFVRIHDKEIMKLYVYPEQKFISMHELANENRNGKIISVNRRSERWDIYPSSHHELGELLKQHHLI